MGQIFLGDEAPQARPTSTFTFKGLSLLRELEYRPLVERGDLEDLFRFRYECYRRKGYIQTNAQKMSYDDLDDDPNVMRFGVYLDGQLVSSIRLQHLTKDKRCGPSVTTFGDIVEPMLDKGITGIDPSRLTTDKDASDEYPLLPYLTVRLAAMASVHFGVNYCFSTIRPTHGAFYKRVIESKQIHDERCYSGMSFPVVLYASDVPNAYPRVFRRYPFFHSLPHERRMLFGDPNASDTSRPLTVLPTADFALAA